MNQTNTTNLIQSTQKGVHQAERESVGSRCIIFRTAASPRWYINYSVDGRQVRKSLKTTKKKQARKLAEDVDARLVLGHLERNERKTPAIDALVDQYLAHKTRQQCKRGTISVYSADLNDLKAYCRHKSVSRPSELTAEFLEEYEDRLASVGMAGIIAEVPKRPKPRRVKQNTLHNKLKAVRQMLNWVIRRGLIKDDPAQGYTLPPRSDEQAYCWTIAEVTAIREHATSDYLLVLDFLRLTGIRVDELCWLTKADVDREFRYIRIRAKTCPQTGYCWEPKHGGERIVPLCELAQCIARQVFAASPGPWLFFAPRSRRKRRGHYTPHRIWTALKATMQRAGVSRGTTHTYRHVFCSFMANQNVPPLKVMKILGHRSLDIILTYYHLSDAELLDALQGLPFECMLSAPRKEVSAAQLPDYQWN